MVTKAHTTYKVQEDIILSDKEKEIFHLFTDFVAQNKVDTAIRVAGGWVRDKMLGRESSDIDFAIENMMGEKFINQAHEYLKSKADVSNKVGVTKSNPEKSKHLETAKIRVSDIWIDVVNLRGEDYDTDSRIPKMRIGTPEEDAYRRDLTINSLFYNLHTELVEDFTKRGVEDLKAGIARTPLPAEKTFDDDPLRILRVFRFVSRYDLLIDEGIV
jgi:tRNA nucleotidyltransferase/poly(A) polymerase